MLQSILVIEDDRGVQKYLKELLTENNFVAKIIGSGIDSLNYLKETKPDVVILDLGLPDIQGESVCLAIRKDYPSLPVIILTAKDSAEEVVKGLNLGADDYITKPFNSEELLARIKARLRTDALTLEDKLKIADLELDTKSFEVKRGGKNLELTPQEFKLLNYLMNNPNRVLTREMILSRVWAYSTDIETRVVDVYMGYLRKKIDSDSNRKLIHSVRGFGYMIKE